MPAALYSLLIGLVLLALFLLIMVFVFKRDLNRARQRIKSLESQRDFNKKHINLLVQQLSQRGGYNDQGSPEDTKPSRSSRASDNDRTRRDSTTGAAAGLSIGTSLTSLF